jgi:hypothetical protein
MQKPKVVVVVVNKAPPQGYFDSFYAEAKDFFTATSWMTSSSTPPVEMTTTPLMTTQSTTTPSTTPALPSQVTRNEPAALTVVSDGDKILYNCTANVSELICHSI